MTSKLSLAVLGLSVVLPASAIAQTGCPTRAMLEGNGIQFRSSLADVEIHRLAANGTIVQDIDYFGDKSQNVLGYGVHVLQLANITDGRIDQGSIWRFAFDVDISALPEPVPNGTWSAQTTSYYQGDATPEKVTHTWGALQQYSIGSCTLNAIPVSVSYDSKDYDHTEEAVYFPDLGTAILTAYIDADGREDYTYTSIRAR